MRQNRPRVHGTALSEFLGHRVLPLFGGSGGGCRFHTGGNVSVPFGISPLPRTLHVPLTATVFCEVEESSGGGDH